MSIRTSDPLLEPKTSQDSKPKPKSLISKYLSNDIKKLMELDEIEEENSKEKQLAANLRKKKKGWMINEILQREQIEAKKSLSPRPSAVKQNTSELDPLGFMFEGTRIKTSEEQKIQEKNEESSEIVKELKKDSPNQQVKTQLLPFERPAESSNSKKNISKQPSRHSVQEKSFVEKRFSREDRNRPSQSKSFYKKNEDLDKREWESTNESRGNFKKNSHSGIPRWTQDKAPENEKSFRKSLSSARPSENSKKFSIQRRSYSISSDFDFRLEDIKENESYKRHNFGPINSYEKTEETGYSKSNDGRGYIMIEEESQDFQEKRRKFEAKQGTSKKTANLKSSSFGGRNRQFDPSENKKSKYSQKEQKRPLMPTPVEIIDLTSDNESFPQLNKQTPRVSSSLSQNTSAPSSSNPHLPRRSHQFLEESAKSPSLSPSKRFSNISSTSSNNLSDTSNDSCFTFNPFSKNSMRMIEGNEKTISFFDDFSRENLEASENRMKRFGEEISCLVIENQDLPQKRFFQRENDGGPHKMMKKAEFDDQNIRPNNSFSDTSYKQANSTESPSSQCSVVQHKRENRSRKQDAKPWSTRKYFNNKKPQRYIPEYMKESQHNQSRR
jgi:hypothetical protein